MKKKTKYTKHIRHKTRRFYIVLAIRTIGNFFVLFSIVWLVIQFGPFLGSELRYQVDQAEHKTYTLDKPKGKTFSTLLKQPPPLVIDPINTDSSLIVERINANSPIILNVDAGDEKGYKESLLQGVAHTKGTVLPGEKGNSYLFAHSVGSPWDVARYNAVFYLLRELEPGDRVVVFRDQWRYDFRVYDKKIVEPQDVEYINAVYDDPVLTMQTCWPPGTVLKRLLVFAKLEQAYPPNSPFSPLLSEVLPSQR